MPLLKVVVANCRESNVASLHNSIETVATLEKDISGLVHPSTSFNQSKEDDPELVGEQHQGDELSHQEENPSSPLLSAASTLSKKGSISSQDICRICHCEAEFEAPLVAPCCCAGSLKYVHQGCLQRWVQSSDMKNCELCKYPFIMQTKIKPFKQWEKLDMSSMERRKLACSVTFHAVAFTCVIWSLYVLIDRSAEEYASGQLQWPFWTKLVVVAIGFTGGVVFMYVQCTMYMTLCRRWRAYNRIILVKDAPSRFGNTTTTTVTLTSDSNKANSVKRKGDKKSPAAPVQSVVTIASAFAGGNIRTKSSSSSSNHCAAVVEPDEAASSQHQLIDANHIINSESLHAEEMAALLDLKIHPSPSQRPPSVDPMPSIHNP